MIAPPITVRDELFDTPLMHFPGVGYDSSEPERAADRAPAYGRLPLPRRGPGGVAGAGAAVSDD